MILFLYYIVSYWQFVLTLVVFNMIFQLYGITEISAPELQVMIQQYLRSLTLVHQTWTTTCIWPTVELWPWIGSLFNLINSHYYDTNCAMKLSENTEPKPDLYRLIQVPWTSVGLLGYCLRNLQGYRKYLLAALSLRLVKFFKLFLLLTNV